MAALRRAVGHAEDHARREGSASEMEEEVNSGQTDPDRSMWAVGCLLLLGALAGSIGAGKVWGGWAGVLCGGIMIYVCGLWIGYLISAEQMAQRSLDMAERGRMNR